MWEAGLGTGTEGFGEGLQARSLSRDRRPQLCPCQHLPAILRSLLSSGSQVGGGSVGKAPRWAAKAPARQPTCLSEPVPRARQGQAPTPEAEGLGGNPIPEGPSLCLVQVAGLARGLLLGPQPLTGGFSGSSIQGPSPRSGGTGTGAQDGRGPGGLRLHLRSGALPATQPWPSTEQVPGGQLPPDLFSPETTRPL